MFIIINLCILVVYIYKNVQYTQVSERLYNALSKTQQQTHDFLMHKRIRNEELINYIINLRQQHANLKMAMLSNVGGGTLEYLFAPGELEKMFDVRVLSYEESLAKPNPEIFTLTAGRLGVAASECVMIDDRVENCEGAEVAGMMALQYTDNELLIKRLNALLEA